MYALDVLGKWALVDTFFLIIMMEAFHLNLSLPGTELEIKVIPKFGLYGYFGATLASLGILHVAHAQHLKSETKQAEMSQSGPFEGSDTSRIACCTYVHERGNLRCRASAAGSAVLSGVQLGAVLMLLVGMGLHITEFDYQGAIVLLLPPDAQQKDYSLLENGRDISRSGTNDFGVGVLQATFFGVTLGIPLVQVLMLQALWYVPLSARGQQMGVQLVHTVHAWAGLDVYLVALVVSVLEIQKVCRFSIGLGQQPAELVCAGQQPAEHVCAGGRVHDRRQV